MKQWLMLAVLLLLVPAALALTSVDSPQIKAVLSSQTPDPVEPGQILTVKFQIENAGRESSQEAIVKLSPQYPFSLYSDVAEKNIGKLRAATTGADAAIVEYKLKVDPNATEGDTELPLEIKLGDAAVRYTHDEFLIHIQSQDANLGILAVTSDPEQVVPGDTATVTIQVKNFASALLKDIKFKLDLQSSTIPFAPYQSSSERRIPLLEPRFQDTLTFHLIADPKATPGLYKIPLNITYNDDQGKSYTTSDVLAVSIGEVPQVRAYIKKSTVLQSEKPGKITLEIANAGPSDIKYVELYLLPSEDYELIATSNYIYIGDIDSDDTSSEDLDIYAKKVDNLRFPVKLRYYDANHNLLQQQFDLELKLHSTSDLKRFGIIPSNNSGLYFILIVIIVVGFWYYRWGRHNSKVQAWIQKKKFW